MKNFYVRKLLNTSQLTLIKDNIQSANDNNYWIDGLNSTGMGGEKRIKNNLELSDPNISKNINDLIMKSLDADFEFLNVTAASHTSPNIVSKTCAGGYYNPHIDMWMNGDYSTTVFLNDPDEYKGGELCLFYGHEEHKIKLESGYAVTYPTGTIHRVNRVVSGSRYVSVFWTTSSLKDSFIRELFYSISQSIQLLKKNDEESVHLSNCIAAQENPIFMLESVKNEILRKYSVR
jgi:PKHD-type hydroxylase